MRGRDAAFYVFLAASFGLLWLQPVEAMDYDGDGYSTVYEVENGGNPLYGNSTPDTDDDGDGQVNREETEFMDTSKLLWPARTVTHSFLLNGGSTGIAHARYGNDESPCGNGRSFERVQYCDGAVLVYDELCLPGAFGDYEACQGAQDESTWLWDGYGWHSYPVRGAV